MENFNNGMAEISTESIAKSDEVKEKANKFFKEQKYDQAIALYTEAIEHNPNNAALYGNRSFAYLKTECFGMAIEDAEKAIATDKNYIKGYYRRASARLSLGQVKKAFKDYEAVYKRRPNDKDAKFKYTECKKLLAQINFNKAIAVESPSSVSQEINLEAMSIEDDYDGPRLENGEVTLKFMKDLLEHYRMQKKLHKKYAYKILLDIEEYFKKQPSLIDIKIADQKFTVCGDIHGQFYDLLNIFELNGLPSQTNPYLFNGDFVDRGSFSVECICVLFGFKLLYKDHFYMSRGNHETATMNEMYGFEGEVRSKYSPLMSSLFTEVYNWLPLCHCINNEVLVMHGGLFSQDNVTLDDLRNIKRNRQPPDEGPMCELLWSDPTEVEGRSASKRGIGVMFGPDVTRNFLEKNNLKYIIRSHEVKPNGYEVAHGGKCITVFSAPNYLDTVGNKGAFITMNGMDLKPNFTMFEAVDHPPVKPMAFASNSLMSRLIMG